MVARSWSEEKERDYCVRVNAFLVGRGRTSTKKIRDQFDITGCRAAQILKELGWIRHRKNGSSGVVYTK